MTPDRLMAEEHAKLKPGAMAAENAKPEQAAPPTEGAMGVMPVEVVKPVQQMQRIVAIMYSEPSVLGEGQAACSGVGTPCSHVAQV